MHDGAGALIERFFPEEKLSEAGRREKKGRPKTFEMHYWWSRKPLVVARAAILGALLPASFAPEEFERHIGLNQKQAPYKAILSEADTDRLRSLFKDLHGKDVTVLDPFAGGGSLPFAGLEGGVNFVASDYNPVAWLILKTTLEYPVTFRETLAAAVEASMQKVIEVLQQSVEHLYASEAGPAAEAYLFAWEVTCPRCSRPTPLVSKWQLASYPDPSRCYYINPVWEGGAWTYQVKQGKSPQGGSCTRATGVCLHADCGAPIPNDWILAQMQGGAREALMVTIASKQVGTAYRPATPGDARLLEQVREELHAKENELLAEDLIPVEEMPLHTIRAAKYLLHWKALFSPRQILFFAHFVRTIRAEVRRLVIAHGSEYGRAIGSYLALLLGKQLDYNCRLTSWIPTREGILHACSNKLNALQWDHAEVNPFCGGSGSLASAAKTIRQGLVYACAHIKQGRVTVANQSLFAMDSGPYDLIVTDPPYFDDAPYGELSEFFHVWESRAIGEFFKDLNPAYKTRITPKLEDLSVSFQRRAGNFDTAFTRACNKMGTLLRDSGILVLFFAHTGLDAWASVTKALQTSRFHITATWAVHTENVGISNWSKDSIYSSIILVARKRSQDLIGTVAEVRVQTQVALEKRLAQLWKMGIRGADLIASGMGAAIGILTQYAEIKDPLNEFDLKFTLQWVKTFVEQFQRKKEIKF